MEKPDIAKLPKNIEAEQALIGALLANNKFYEKIADILKPEHFADDTLRKIVSYQQFNYMATDVAGTADDLNFRL